MIVVPLIGQDDLGHFKSSNTVLIKSDAVGTTFQWTYYTGNTWGKCEDGTEEMGCGPQETFRNCADITIYRLVPNRQLRIVDRC